MANNRRRNIFDGEIAEVKNDRIKNKNKRFAKFFCSIDKRLRVAAGSFRIGIEKYSFRAFSANQRGATGKGGIR